MMKKKKLNVTEIETQTNEHWIQTVDRGNSEALLSKCKATSPATSKKMWISWKWQKKNRNNFNRRTHEENQYSPILLWHANTGCKRQPLCLKRRLRQSCIAAPNTSMSSVWTASRLRLGLNASETFTKQWTQKYY